MSIDDNVIKMPDQLERRAQKIDAALTRQDDANDRSDKADEDWRAATLDLAVELAGAKAELNNNDQAFGKWCSERFGGNRIPHQDRAALVRWGANPEGTKAMLAKDNSRSIQMIDRRFTNASKPARTTTAKREEAEASIRIHKAIHGVYPTVLEAGKVTGLSRIVIEPALATVKAEDRVAPTELRFTKAQDAHVEARLKARRQELEREFDARVMAENKRQIDILFPKLEKIQESAKLAEKYQREQLEKNDVFTEAEYRDLLLCTHEANPSEDTRQRAFMVLNAKKFQLTGKR